LAPPRSFDYDILNQIMRDRPELEVRELARLMTNYERFQCPLGIHWLDDIQCGSPRYPVIKPNSVSHAVSQLRATWEDEGRPVRDRPYGRLIPWPGIPEEYSMDTRLRHLKTLAQIDRGQTVTPTRERQATAFKADLERRKHVIDITDEGEPYDRPARPGELDRHGRLRKLTADVREDWLDGPGPPSVARRGRRAS
jgi:hypothetical protein